MARRNVNQYNWDKLQFDETLLTRHFTRQASKKVRYIVIHHMIVRNSDVDDDEALDACYRIWQSRPASAHYGVDGRFVRQFVWDKDYAWATGNTNGNRYGISIEHANMTLDESGSSRDYMIDEETWKNGAKLAAYLHKVHRMGRPVKNVTLKKHSHFSATACPGPYMDKIWDQYYREVVRVYDTIMSGGNPGSPSSSSKPVASKPSSPSKPSKKPSTGNAPKFPLPRGSYFGPKSGPKASVSGYYSHRDDLKRWQKRMKTRGWSIGVDGLYGPNTKKVATAFQKEKGLSVDGKIGPETWAAAWNAKIT